MLAELKTIANKKDVPYQSLAKIYLARQIAFERGFFRSTQKKRSRKTEVQQTTWAVFESPRPFRNGSVFRSQNPTQTIITKALTFDNFIPIFKQKEVGFDPQPGICFEKRIIQPFLMLKKPVSCRFDRFSDERVSSSWNVLVHQFIDVFSHSLGIVKPIVDKMILETQVLFVEEVEQILLSGTALKFSNSYSDNR
jgi:hypothetical protein